MATTALLAGLYLVWSLPVLNLVAVTLVTAATILALYFLWWRTSDTEYFVELDQAGMTAQILGRTRVPYSDIHSVEIDSRGRTVIRFERAVWTTMLGILKLPLPRWRLPISDPGEFGRSFASLKAAHSQTESSSE